MTGGYGRMNGGVRSRASRLLVGAGFVLLASCSSDEPNAVDQAAAYCDATADLVGIETLLSPESIRDPAGVESAFRQFEDSLQGVQDVSPVQIEGDIETLGTAITDAISTLDSVSFDITQLDDARATTLIEIFQRPEVRTSSERIEAYDTLNCSDRATPTAPDDLTEAPTTDASTVPPETPTVNANQDIAFEYEELIRTTFTDDEIEATLAFAEVTTMSELVAKITSGDIEIDEIDLFLQRRSDGLPFAFGDDPELDILWNACENDDWAACDGLFQGAPLQSLYQRFAETCGREFDTPNGGQCVALLDS